MSCEKFVKINGGKGRPKKDDPCGSCGILSAEHPRPDKTTPAPTPAPAPTSETPEEEEITGIPGEEEDDDDGPVIVTVDPNLTFEQLQIRRSILLRDLEYEFRAGSEDKAKIASMERRLYAVEDRMDELELASQLAAEAEIEVEDENTVASE